MNVMKCTVTNILTCILVEPLYASLTGERLLFTDLQCVVFSENTADEVVSQPNSIATTIFPTTFHLLIFLYKT